MKLTDTQLVLLSAASQREDEYFVSPEKVHQGSDGIRLAD